MWTATTGKYPFFFLTAETSDVAGYPGWSQTGPRSGSNLNACKKVGPCLATRHPDPSLLKARFVLTGERRVARERERDDKERMEVKRGRSRAFLSLCFHGVKKNLPPLKDIG